MNNIVYINSDDNDKQISNWCDCSSIDDLVSEVNNVARSIHQTLKPGLPICVYQLTLYNELLKKGLQLQTEMSRLNLAVEYEDERELIIVNGALVIECVVEHTIKNHYHKRVMFDLENNGYSSGLLINFSDEFHSKMITTVNHHSVIH